MTDGLGARLDHQKRASRV